MLQTLPRVMFSMLAGSVVLKRVASRYGMRQADSFARRFIAGETVDDALAVAAPIERAGLSVTFDYLGKSLSTSAETAEATRAYLAVIEAVDKAGASRNVSVRLTQLGLDVDRATSVDNLRRILDAAAKAGFFVRIEMDTAHTEATLDILETLWNIGYRSAGVALQAALRRSEADIRRMNALGVRVRLENGASREPRDVAFQQKIEVDQAFVELMHLLLLDGAHPTIATHDEAMIDATRQFADATGITQDRFEFQMSYGVCNDLQSQLAAAGYSVRVYLPFGKEWFPYFMRRLGEKS